MNLTKDTPVSELMHSSNLLYVDIDEGELRHWKYIKREKLPNGKWRYYYDMEATYNTVVKAADTAAKIKKKTEATKKDLSNKLRKLDRYSMAAEEWISWRTHMSISDIFKGVKPISWQEAKESVDWWYRKGDPDKLLTDKYRKNKK